MAIHKFIRKRGRVPRRPPVAVIWHPHDGLDYPPAQVEEFKWQVFAQLDKTIEPHFNYASVLKYLWVSFFYH